MHTLIWPGVVLVLGLVISIGSLKLSRDVLKRRDARQMIDGGATSQLAIIDAAERTFKLEIRKRMPDIEGELERARLKAEIAQYDIDEEAIRRTLTTAVRTREQVLEARAQAAVKSAPEFVRDTMDNTRVEMMKILMAGYETYVRECDEDVPPSLSYWIGSVDNLAALGFPSNSGLVLD